MLAVGTAFAQPAPKENSAFPPLPPALILILHSEDRDATVAAEGHRLFEVSHRLIQIAVNERVGRPDAELGVAASAFLADLAERSQRVLGITWLAEDAHCVMQMAEGVARQRATLRARAEVVWRSYRRSRNDAAARPRSVAELEELLGLLREFSTRHEDRDLVRYAVLLEVFFRRDCALGEGGDPAALATSLEDLVATFDRHGLAADERCLLGQIELAHLALESDRLEDASRLVDGARRNTRSHPFPDELRARVLSLEIQAYAARGFDDAADDAALRMEQLLPELSELARALPRSFLGSLVGEYHRQAAIRRAYRGDHATAAKMLERGLETPALEATQKLRFQGALAVELQTMGKDVEALDLAASVLRGLDRVPDAGSDADLLHELGLQMELVRAEGASRLGQIEIARQALVDARIRITGREDSLPVESRARLQLATGLAASADGDLDRAIAAYEQVLGLVPPDARPRTETVQALWALTRIHLLLGDEDTASRRAFSALDAARQVRIDRRLLVFNSQIGIADVFLARKRANDALQRLEEALAAAGTVERDRPDIYGRALRLRAASRWQIWREEAGDVALLERLAEELRTALTHLAQPSTSRSPETVAEMLRSYELLQEIHLDAGQEKLAREAVSSAEARWAETADGIARGGETSLAWKECRALARLIAARQLEHDGRIEAAIAAYREAAQLEDRLRHGLRYRAPDGLSARFESINDRIAGLLLTRAEQSGSDALTREAILFLEQVRARSLRTLLASARTRYRGPRALWPQTLAAPPRLDAESLAGLTPPERAVLVYALTGRGSFVIAIRGERVAVASIALPPVGMERQVEALLHNMQGAPTAYKIDAIRDYGHLLYQNLVAPVESFLDGARELVVIPDGPLHGLPFAVLVEGGAAAEGRGADLESIPFLLRRSSLQTIAYAPSLATIALLEARPPPSSDSDLILLGSPTLVDSDLAPLSHSKEELDSIASLFPKEQVRYLVGDQARLGELSRHAATCRTLHIATHARRAPGDRGSSYLVLSGSEVLGVAEAVGLDLRQTQLVVLSACASGRGPLAGGEGILGLPRAFIIAGARAVVAALVDVHDDATARLMRIFYEGHAEAGGRPGAAMLAAQRAMLAEPETSWPGFWAPFFVIGLP